MQITYKHIVLVLIILALIFYLRSNRKIENLDDVVDGPVVDSVTFNADDYLMNLTEEDAKKMLVSNKITSWVKYMESDDADVLYNNLFIDNSNPEMFIKDLVTNVIDGNIESYITANTVANNASVANKTLLHTKIQNELKQNTETEINDFGNQYGFELSGTTLRLPSNGDLISKIDTYLNNSTNNYNSALVVNLNGLSVSIPSKNDTKANATSLAAEEGITDINNINLQNFPNVLKYRVRNNRDYVANSIANIINSMAMQKGLDWKKINVGGAVISDTTVNPRNIMNYKKNKIIRLKNLVFEDVARPYSLIPSTFSEKKRKHVYDILLNLLHKEYDSEDVTLATSFTNSLGQVVWSDVINELYPLVSNILEHLKEENAFQVNPAKFVRCERNSSGEKLVDDLGLPLYMHDPYPPPTVASRKIFRSSNSTGLFQDNEILNIEDINDDGSVTIVPILKIIRRDVNGVSEKIYQINVKGEWKDNSFPNLFEWEIPDLEEIGRNLTNESEKDRKFDIVAINNILSKIGKDNSKDIYYNRIIPDLDDDGTELPLPIKYKNPYPLKWEGTSQRTYALDNEEVVFKRMKVASNGVTLVKSNITGALADGEVIVGKNDNILVKIAYVNGVRTYQDAKGLSFPNIDITETSGKIGWKVKFLENKFNITSDSVIKKDLTILNLLIVAKGNAEIIRKNALLPYGARNKVSLVIKNPPKKMGKDSDGNDALITDSNNVLSDLDKEAVYSGIASGLNIYNLINDGNSVDISGSQIASMNRLNLASMVENGIQRVERLLIKKNCVSRETYPDGTVLNDAAGKEIKYLYMSDILRLQKAMFGSFTNYVEPEDGLKDVLYAGYRLKLILSVKSDTTGMFILNQISTDEKRNEITQIINAVNAVDFAFIDPEDTNSIQTGVLDLGVTNENLGKIYQYLSLSDYFSVKIDLSRLPAYYTSIYAQIDSNKQIIRDELCAEARNIYINSDLETLVRTQIPNATNKQVSDEICDMKLNYTCTVSDDSILDRYHYINAKNAVEEVEERLSSMKVEKQTQILDIIKENIRVRQNPNYTNLSASIDNITLNSTFKELKEMHLNILENSPQVVEVAAFTDTFSVAGYNKNNMYFEYK
jgi:hypothetical protein